MANKVKMFGAAMQVVRKAPRDKAGKLKDKDLGRLTRSLLQAMCEKRWESANVLAESIVEGNKP